MKAYLLKIIFFCGLMALALPNLFIYWMLIDDGYTILVDQKLTLLVRNLDLPGIGGILVESQYGRFRPLYWIYNWIVYLIGGNEPSVHRLFHIGIYLLIIFVIYKVSYRLTKSRAFSLLGSALFAVTPLNLENWMRLGPVEPILGLLLLLSAYFLIVRRNWKLSVFFMFLSFLTKETAIAIIPPLAVLYLGEKFILKKRKESQQIFRTLLIGLLFSLGLILITLSIRVGYSQYYSLNVYRMITSSLEYLKLTRREFSPFFEISLIAFGLSILRDFRQNIFHQIKTKELYGTFFLASYLSLILIQSPWVFTMERYMLPSLVFLSIFMAVYLQKMWLFVAPFFAQND